MIAYSTGLCVLWNLKNKSADRRFAHYPKDNHVSVVSLILLVAHSIMNCHPTYNRLIFECHCVHGNVCSLLIPWPLADSTTLLFLHTAGTSKKKWRGGICSNIQLVPCICPPPHLWFLQSRWLLRLFGRMAASLNMHHGKPAALVLILSREAS